MDDNPSLKTVSSVIIQPSEPPHEDHLEIDIADVNIHRVDSILGKSEKETVPKDETVEKDNSSNTFGFKKQFVALYRLILHRLPRSIMQSNFIEQHLFKAHYKITERQTRIYVAFLSLFFIFFFVYNTVGTLIVVIKLQRFSVHGIINMVLHIYTLFNNCRYGP